MSRIVVVGDALLDWDIEGRADRLCPDAPVPVLTQTNATLRPGGAALAATMLALDGADVTLVAAAGADEAGERVRSLLHGHGVALEELSYDGPTPEKIRLRAGNHPLMRLDRGASVGSYGAVTAAIGPVLDGVDAILVSDYGRGVTSLLGLRRCLATAAERTAVVWDPHPRGASPVHGARVICPNRAETAIFAAQHGAVDEPTQHGALAAEAGLLRQAWRATAVAVTTGAHGALLVRRDRAPAVVAPPMACHGADTCGAGDRFAAALTFQLAARVGVAAAVTAAVHAASHYVANGGPAALSVLELEGSS